MVGTAYLFAVCVGLTISMALIPLLVRAAPRFGLLDVPDSRKVHATPIPRVGGVAIVIGGLVAMLFLVPLDRLMQSYLLGVAVLFTLGVWDDIREIGHYTKFAGQFAAVSILVLHGDVYITRLPFGWETVPPEFGIPFTIFAIVGMINAINHSDGLDGLAGGESLLSLVAIGYLAHVAGAIDVVIIAAAMIGGILGFLRFNTHPARIFMGDAGSQVLGLTLGFLAVLLTQNVNPALSAALPALLLGLPICDILGVLYLRITHGMNWFRASRNHIHHRLLALDLAHHESVVVIYSIQMLLVLLGVLLRFETDVLVLGVYLVIVSAVFTVLTVAERSSWRADRFRRENRLLRSLGDGRLDPRLGDWSLTALRVLIPGYLILINVLAGAPPYDIGLVAAVVFAVILLEMAFGNGKSSVLVRAAVYVAVIFTVYMDMVHGPLWLEAHGIWITAFFGLIAVLIGVNLRTRERAIFELTPFDYLVVCAVIGLVVIGQEQRLSDEIAAGAVKAVVLLYGCELILTAARRRLGVLNIATAAALGIMCLRGLT
ncbi:MAG: MraY family glycosyltransferase [Gammaproteobacteria bacterium]|nr:MraY family glycosyltransferase [Gammaproteobacteria bacterium]